MNSNCLLAFTEVMTHHSVLQWFIADTISTETGTTGSGTVEKKKKELEYFTKFYLFQAWTWQLTITNLRNFVKEDGLHV